MNWMKLQAYSCEHVLSLQHQKQVDILISKNQVLQMLYFKHHAY